MSPLQTGPGHSLEVKGMYFNPSAGIISFDSENPDINITSLHEILHSSSIDNDRNRVPLSRTSTEYEPH